VVTALLVAVLLATLELRGGLDMRGSAPRASVPRTTMLQSSHDVDEHSSDEVDVLASTSSHQPRDHFNLVDDGIDGVGAAADNAAHGGCGVPTDVLKSGVRTLGDAGGALTAANMSPAHTAAGLTWQARGAGDNGAPDNDDEDAWVALALAEEEAEHEQRTQYDAHAVAELLTEHASLVAADSANGEVGTASACMRLFSTLASSLARSPPYATSAAAHDGSLLRTLYGDVLRVRVGAVHMDILLRCWQSWAPPHPSTTRSPHPPPTLPSPPHSSACRHTRWVCSG